LEYTDVSEVPTAFNALMMEAVRISETVFYSDEITRRYIPEDSYVHLTIRLQNVSEEFNKSCVLLSSMANHDFFFLHALSNSSDIKSYVVPSTEAVM
jgi:hypothetical protein